MTTAAQLISQRVVVGTTTERLSDVAPRIKAAAAHHCAVVDDVGKFRGLIRLEDVAGYSHAGNRILADLVSPVRPLIVRSSEPAESVTYLFGKHQLCEAVVLSDAGEYIGMATAESVVQFLLKEGKRLDETLQNTEAKLRAATNAKDIFLKSLSHDLRTPLNPVLILASQGAADATLPDEVREYFEVIATQTLLEAHLIDSLLDLTSVIEGTIRLESKLLDLRTVLQNVVDQAQSFVGNRGPELQVGFAPDAALVMGDPAKLDQAFRNLVRNAFASTERGGHVRVSSQSDLGAGRIAITISDDGRGMTEAELSNSFDPFPHDSNPAGSLGARKISPSLTLARAIIVLHSGTIEATSEGLGKGTTFKVVLPLAQPSKIE